MPDDVTPSLPRKNYLQSLSAQDVLKSFDAEPLTSLSPITELSIPLSLLDDAFTAVLSSFDDALEITTALAATDELTSELTRLRNSVAIMSDMYTNDPLRVIRAGETLLEFLDQYDRNAPLKEEMSHILSESLTEDGKPDTLETYVSEAVELAKHYTRDALNRLAISLDSAPPQLSSVLPTQKPAPLRFKIEADVLRVDHIPAEAEEDVARATASTRAQLAENGRALIEALKAAGNVDRRVLQTVEQLQTLLASQQDVVQLAIANIGAEFVFAGAEEEMSATLFGALRGFSQGIAMYAAQFPDWQKFAENAAAVDLTEQDVAAVVADARALVAKLESAAPNVDPEVPKTIAFLLDLIGKPAHTSKRAFFAVVRTLENLAASIFQRAASMWGATLDGAAEGMKGGTKKVVTVTLIAVAIQAATGLGPVAAKLPDAKWVTQALEIVKKQLETAPKG